MKWALPLLMAATGCKADPTGGFGGGGNATGASTSSGTSGGSSGSDDGGSDGQDTGDTGNNGDSGGSGGTGDDTGSLPCEEHGVDWGMSIGLGSGDLVPDMNDGLGWSLYEHCGRPISIMVGNLYDASFLNSLAGIAEVQETHSNLLAIAFIGYDASEEIADQDDATEVQSNYGLNVVFYDPTLTEFNNWAQFAPPKTYLVDDALVIRWVNQGYADPVQIADKISSF